MQSCPVCSSCERRRAEIEDGDPGAAVQGREDAQPGFPTGHGRAGGFVRNSLRSALEGKQPRSDKHRKRRHVHQEEELAGTDGADNGVGITGEANGGGGRWGHDMYEKEYGEPMPIKGNKKRNL